MTNPTLADLSEALAVALIVLTLFCAGCGAVVVRRIFKGRHPPLEAMHAAFKKAKEKR